MEKLKAWLPVILYCVVIFTVSGFPITLPKQTPGFFDKIVHVVEYAVLGLLISRAFKIQDFKITLTYKIIFITELSLLYGASDELHQIFVPGRFASALDLLADGIGGFIGTIIYNYGRDKTI